MNSVAQSASQPVSQHGSLLVITGRRHGEYRAVLCCVVREGGREGGVSHIYYDYLCEV